MGAFGKTFQARGGLLCLGFLPTFCSTGQDDCCPCCGREDLKEEKYCVRLVGQGLPLVVSRLGSPCWTLGYVPLPPPYHLDLLAARREAKAGQPPRNRRGLFGGGDAAPPKQGNGETAGQPHTS